MVLYCDNPRSYYFGEEVDPDFKEECGRSCRVCPYAYSPESDPIVQMSEKLLDELRKTRNLIKAIKKALKYTEDKREREELEETLRELRWKEREIEDQIREFRRDLERMEVYPF